MSLVTGVVFQTSCAERSVWIHAINAWLDLHGFSALHQVDDLCCNGKHPQLHIYGGGYNYFRPIKFLEFVKSLLWEYPDQVVLLITTEQDPTIVLSYEIVKEGFSGIS